ncbi:alpha/beta hydrolase [Pendulispora brunnea]|uniref:Alpha/beta hydrolase n=1 Tax=Pendulispora brunnea TaxID=2905690 RepID=A0ABZ2KK60_9BACT
MQRRTAFLFLSSLLGFGAIACGGSNAGSPPQDAVSMGMGDSYIERSEGVRIHYTDEGHGLPVLLLHAYPVQGAMFRPQIAALGAKYRFIVVDHRGFGKSRIARSADATPMSEMADDALAVLDALKIDQAVVGGVSMGGYIAMEVVRRAPHRVKGLVLSDTQSGADDDAGRAKREDAAKKALESGMQGVADAMLPKLLAPSAPADIRAHVTELILGNSPEGAAAAQRGMAKRSDSADVLSHYEGPALVLVGEKDELIPPEKAQKMASQLKNATLAVVPRAGHLPNIEAPDEFNRELDAFLSRIRP